MNNLFYTFLFICVVGCNAYDNVKCAPNYIGTFKIDPKSLLDSNTTEYVRTNRWDTVELISEKNGKYYFRSNDSLLKKAEGSWYVTTTGIEGGCMGVIKQNNWHIETPAQAFSILIRMSDSVVIDLPFRKIVKL